MELKEGMYVRDEYYGIGQVKDICTCEECKKRGFYEPIISYANHTEYVSSYNNMQLYEGKASHNIIDLIEVGDIVTTKHLGLEKEYIEVIDNETSLEILKSYFKEKSLELISVVTKQQFESMQYEVKE